MMKLVRGAIAAFVGLLGFTGAWFFVLSDLYAQQFEVHGVVLRIGVLGIATLVFLIIGYMIAPLMIRTARNLLRWWENRLQNMPAADLIGGIIGLIIGLIIASLLGPALAGIPFVGDYLPLITSVIMGYLGLSLGIKKRDDFINLNMSRIRTFTGKEKKKETFGDAGASQTSAVQPAADAIRSGDACSYKILDTSVIIDGRVADIYRTGFLAGKIVIPRFVLTELQHIADSSDALKRNRGRRGLDILNAMRKDMNGVIQIVDSDFPEVAEVDAKLVSLAQQMSGDILTNDYNLNKVAELQGVRVLNINDLVNALKPVFLPGEEMQVLVLKEGKEQRQGIGYLDDGTMIVVDAGKKYINQTIYAIVTSVLQTSAGRMIFVKPKFNDDRVLVEERHIV